MNEICSQRFKSVFGIDSIHLGCGTMSLGEYLPTFRITALISFARCKSNRNEIVQIVPYLFSPDEGTSLAFRDFVSSTVQHCLIMRIKVLRSSETLGNSHTTTQHHVLEGLPLK